jgi:hypothetical protein
LLSFAIVYFSESGLFNGLQPIQIKKILSAVTLSLERRTGPQPRRQSKATVRGGDWEINSTDPRIFAT